MSGFVIVLDDTVEVFTNRFAVPMSVNVTREMAAQQAVMSATVQSGSGTMVVIDVMSPTLAEARADD